MFDLKKLKNLAAFFIISAVIFGCVSHYTGIKTFAENDAVHLPILMYHHMLEKNSKLNKYTVSPEEFENDLKYIAEHGYTAVTLKDLSDYCENGKKLPERPIMITFDDGYESVYVYAFPLLKKYNMPAVVNVIGRYADVYSAADDHNVNYSHITWEQLKEMKDSGLCEIQNHTYNMHTNSNGRIGIQKKKGESAEQYQKILSEDLIKMQKRTKEMLGDEPTAFAYPFGQISKEALPIIKSTGIKAVFCCWERVNALTGDSEQLYHLNRFNRPHGTSSDAFFKKIEKQLPES